MLGAGAPGACLWGFAWGWLAGRRQGGHREAWGALRGRHVPRQQFRRLSGQLEYSVGRSVGGFQMYSLTARRAWRCAFCHIVITVCEPGNFHICQWLDFQISMGSCCLGQNFLTVMRLRLSRVDVSVPNSGAGSGKACLIPSKSLRVLPGLHTLESTVCRTQQFLEFTNLTGRWLLADLGLLCRCPLSQLSQFF